MTHLVLLGDSIFDNRLDCRNSGTALKQQERMTLPNDGKVIEDARDYG